MKSKNRLKLAIAMIAIAITVAFAIATVDYLKQKKFIIGSHDFLINQIEEIVKDSVETIEKAYAIFDQQTESYMETSTRTLIDSYETNPHFDTWDFESLKEDLGMDVYMINHENVITHSSLPSDVGLDFNSCCRSLAETLDERRVSEEFFLDRMDLEQETGSVKMYSYMATPDQKYIVQLGYNLQDGEIFEEFNFLTVMEDLKNKHSAINEIHVLNIGGLALGTSSNEVHLSGERRAAFDGALASGEMVEIEADWQDNEVLHRYVPYVSAYDVGTSKNKVIEIIYNDDDLQSVLQENKVYFITQLSIILFIIFVITFVIHKWVSKQVYFAYHDGLTRLKNRAAFDDSIELALANSKKVHTGFMMLDLDNFKLVNDYLGHDKGDYLLQLIGQTIEKSLPEKGEAFRLGGDEFAVIFPFEEKQEVNEVAEFILTSIEEEVGRENELIHFNITASVGISLAPEHSDIPEEIYKKADIALYRAKEKGKNQYCIYGDEIVRDEII